MYMKSSRLIPAVRWTFFILSVPLFCWGYFKLQFNTALAGIVSIWICSIIFSAEDIRDRIYFLLFNAAQFVFLIVNPLISAFKGEAWWERFWLFAESFAVLGVYLSTLALYLGAVCITIYAKHRPKKKNNKQGAMTKFESGYLPYIQVVALAGYAIAWILEMGVGIEKVIFMHGRTYIDYYARFQSNIPYVLHTAASMMPMKSKIPVMSAITGLRPELIMLAMVTSALPASGKPATRADIVAPMRAVM